MARPPAAWYDPAVPTRTVLQPERPGVYVLRFGRSPAGPVYVGVSKAVHARVANHIRRLFDGDHESPDVQRAFEQSGGFLRLTVRLVPVALCRLLVLERETIAHQLKLGRTVLNRHKLPDGHRSDGPTPGDADSSPPTVAA